MNKLAPGDLVLVNLNPTQGSEQKSYDKGRPCLVIGGPFNWGSLAIVVPLTTTNYGWVTHIAVHSNKTSYAMCEQIRAIDTTRISRKVGVINYDDLLDVQQTTARLIGVYPK